MKKLICIITLFSVLFAVGCTSVIPQDNSDSIAIDELAEDVKKDLPAASDRLKPILETIETEKEDFDDCFSVIVAAYNALEGEAFCDFADDYIADEMNKFLVNVSVEIATAGKTNDPSALLEDPSSFLDFTSFSSDLSALNVKLASWRMDYSSLDFSKDEDITYDTLKDDLGDIINEYAELIYGEDII